MARNYQRNLPPGSLVRTTVCQYCAVGCGYRALLTPIKKSHDEESRTDVISPAFISPSMRGRVRYRGVEYEAAVAPDARCDLNRGNHSVRGGSQGANLVGPKPKPPRPGRDKDDRLRSPMVRCDDGKLHEITWETAKDVMGRLVVKSAGLRKQGDKLKATTPGRLGVKLFEYQYLENTYAATKLFLRAIGTPNIAFHDRPSLAGSSPGLKDAGYGPHDFAYEDMRHADILFIAGSNPYENQSVFFMQNLAGKEMIVLDPRETATARYAKETGGLHLQPTKLGADSLVLFALTRALLEKLQEEKEDPIHPDIARDLKTECIAEMVKDKIKGPEPPWLAIRRASRAIGLKDFKKFLGVKAPHHKRTKSKYSLKHASEMSGIAVDALEEAVDRLTAKLPNHKKPGEKRLPIVGTLYEKGLIWGFNYHNTAAVAAFGLVLWREGMPAPLTGRCGGHQKGWAEAKGNIDGFTPVNDAGGYPYANAADTYGDERLEDLKKRKIRVPNWKDSRIKVRHNLDTHVFGPDEMLEPKPIRTKTGDGRKQVCLKNGVHTCAEPDVDLLWIIGGNYLGQTHASQWKQEKLRERLAPSGHRSLPAKPTRNRKLKAGDIFKALEKRMDADGGLVVIHQDIFPNPTTELADLVLPAAGWGEEDFIRYNAERRLRLYERFQDPPLHPKDKNGKDPFADLEKLKHSPKPDWVIFRDIASEAIRIKKGSAAARKEFAWKSSAEIADEMAGKHDDGETVRSNRTDWIYDVLKFAKDRGATENTRLHKVLGKDGNGNSQLLEKGYSVPGGSEVLGNGVATNGILLPAKHQIYRDKEGNEIPEESTLEGTLRRGPKKDVKLNFVKADWGEIEGFFAQFQPAKDELAITCGRVNHLWNNVFSHIRNDYVTERYPEDLPGTILEVNPKWAKSQKFVNGQVVDVEDGDHKFTAVISKQKALPKGTAFAVFSFPVWDYKDKEFTFRGYPNNIMFGYFDGINPIGTLKYAKGKVVARSQKDAKGNVVADPWIFESKERQGPSYAQRNRIVAKVSKKLRDRPDKKTGRWSYKRRLDWRMRELIVARGLPRAFVHSGEKRQEALLDPDATFDYLKSQLRGVFGMMLAAMRWPTKDENGIEAGTWDRWDGADLALAMEWSRSVEPDKKVDGKHPKPPNTKNAKLEKFFLAWSKHLTGFDDLEIDHARSLLRRLEHRRPDLGKQLRSLAKKGSVWPGGSDDLTVKAKTELEKNQELAEVITVLWYNGAFHGPFGFPEAEENDGPDKGFGNMHEDHYRRGLVWRAAGLQPQGYSTKLEQWSEPIPRNEREDSK